jgi:hypothetical protein
MKKTFDIQFHDYFDSESKGWKESLEYCMNYIEIHNNGKNKDWTAYDIVQVVCNETGEVYHEESILNLID